ncbi:hypothetical protein Q7P37_009468 [Cladosporium fusiforme]
MDHQTLHAASDDNFFRVGSSSHTNGQYGVRETRMEGSVTIRLERHDPVPTYQPQLQVKPSEYTWLDENDSCIIYHKFKNSLDVHYLWKDDETRHPWTVEFDIGEIMASEVSCDHHQTPHRKSMLSYEFSSLNDYKRFQSMFRGKRFIRDYDITSIDFGRSDILKKKKQCIKSWELNADITLTIPVSQKAPTGSHPSWVIKHLEIPTSWMKWERTKTKAVKAEYKKACKEPSAVDDPAPVRRRSSLLEAFSRTKQHSPSVSSTEDETRATPGLAPKWSKFVIEFSEGKVRDDFFQEVTELPFPPSPYLSQSPPATQYSSPPAQSVSTSSYHQMTPETPPTKPPSLHKIPVSNQNADLRPDDREAVNLQQFTSSLLRDDYMRTGGPSAAPRPISASPSQFYRKLVNSEDEFRVLRIEGGKHQSPLSCSLFVERLDTPPKYEAVSYCWGIEAATRKIREGNLKGCLVSEHLWRALKRLRMPSEDRLVWIDAICINQQDVDERNHQLALMRRIYAKALRTIIWIGDFDPDKKSCKRGFLDDGDTGWTLCVSPGLAETEHENAVEDLRTDLGRLELQSRSKGKSDVWWRRLWCIQEFHFSAFEPSVYIGTHAVKWDHFYDLFEEENHPLATFRQLRHKTPKTLGGLLALTGEFNSSDPRDRVFALLGMASAAGAAIPPDYRHSVIRVIEEAVMYLIEESSTVDILLDGRATRLAWGKDRLTGVMPTWIPDLTKLLKAGYMFDSNTDDVLDSHKYNAGLSRGKSSRKPSVRLSPSATHFSTVDNIEYDIPRTMHCCAWYFDVIEKRTTREKLPPFEESPNGYLIYNSRQTRGRIIDWILNELEYDFDALSKSKKRVKHDLDLNPRIGLLLLDYLLEGRRSHVDELKRRVKPPERDVTKSYASQLKEDLEYVNEESNMYRVDVKADISYIRERWTSKIAREQNNERFIPERLEPALRSRNKSIQDDFDVARDLGNLFAYARGTLDRFYLNKTNFDAPMRKDVLGCSSIAEVKKLSTQFESGNIDIEIHEYNAKSRERDFFKTKAGFLGLGPACLEVGDKIVVPLSASRPFILREDREQSGYHTFIGEAVVPSIMSGRWATLEEDSWKEFKIK